MIEAKWRTCIKPEYKKHCVLKASIVGGLGVCGLVAAGSFGSLPFLSTWGLPIFLLCGGLIAWSMQPYRRMVKSENQPDELWINAKDELIYVKEQKPVFTVPLTAINTLFYFDKPSGYGICLSLKLKHPTKIRVHDLSYPFARMQKNTIRQQGCDIFFPFFSERALKELKEYLPEEAGARATS